MKVPEPRKLKSGNWFIQLRLNGESIPITASTSTECKLIAELTKAEHRAGKAVVKKLPKNTTLQEVIDKYIADNRATLSPPTERSYISYSKNRFVKYRSKTLSKIEWQKMIDDELQYVSEKTVKNAWRLITPALKHIGYPVPTVRLSPVPVKEIPFLQPEEIKPFCEAVKGRSYEIPALLELHGLRLSEVKGLTWNNIDLKNDVMIIKGAMVRGTTGMVSKPQNKNKTSTRPVPIMIPQLHDALAAVQDKTGTVVTLNGDTLLEDVKRSCKRARVTVVTNHGLRHSFASLCFHLNIPVKQIQEWGGWKDDDVLNRIYIRLSATMKTENQHTFTKFFGDSKNENANKNANKIKKARN